MLNYAAPPHAPNHGRTAFENPLNGAKRRLPAAQSWIGRGLGARKGALCSQVVVQVAGSINHLGCRMNMLASTCKAALNMVAPKIYASLKLSRARQSFPEDELHIAPLLCDKTKTSIDIGACGGVYTVHIVNASRDCLAFEPNPKESSKLVEMITNLSLPARVETLALSDSPGKANLRIPEKDGGRSTIEKLNRHEDVDDSQVFEIAVPTRRLDDYELDAVGFIKIDVEGHELAVLRGGAETIRRFLPILLIEIEERHKPNSIGDVSAFLFTFGYKGYFLLNRKLLPISDFDKFKHQDARNIDERGIRHGIYVNNFFFVPMEAISKLNDSVDRVKDHLTVYAG
jgi:FkbM family methyltransferase